jgi:hypothetical protein
MGAVFNLLYNEWEVKVLKWGYNIDKYSIFQSKSAIIIIPLHTNRVSTIYNTGKCKIQWKTQMILALKNAPSYI